MKYVLALLLTFLLACQPAEPVQEAKPVVPIIEPTPELTIEEEPLVEPVPEPVVQQEPVAPKPVVPEVVAAPEPKTTEIVISGLSFSPETLTIKVNDTILWKQEDSTPHTVTTTQGPNTFDSGIMRTGQSFSFRFQVPGTYYVKCALHPIMRQKIIVEP